MKYLFTVEDADMMRRYEAFAADVRKDIKHLELRPEDIINGICEEIGVFEIGKQTQVYCHGKSQ